MNSQQTLFRPTFAEINFSALTSNLKKLRALTKEDSFFCPMIKANAYGHGAAEIAKFLVSEGVEHLGVSLIEEAILLRQSGIKTDILVFGAFSDLQSAKACIEYSLTPVISNNHQMNALEQVAANTELNFHLKFDTGMNRLGFAAAQAQQLRSHFAKFSKWSLKGVCTHLLKGDDGGEQSGFTAKQVSAFESVVKNFASSNICVHALNSSGLISSTHLNKLGARPGIALYGGIDGFEPVMSLKSKIIATREVLAGESVSYNATWIAKRKSLIGIVPIGYADGVQRSLSNKFSVLCREQRVPAVGTVCMDYVLVDLTDLRQHSSSQTPFLGEGEEVVFFGSQGRAVISALEWAKIIGTISYEIFTSISSRVPRKYVRT